MAGKKYGDILKAARNLPYLESYIKWMTSSESRQPNVGKGKPKKVSKKFGVIPFNVPLVAGQIAYESGALTAWEAHSGQMGSHTIALTSANVGSVVRLERFTAARINIVSGRSATGTVKKSHITGREYVSHGGTSTSLPFGKTSETATETEESVFATLSAAIRGASTTGIIVTLKPEKFATISL